MTRLLKAARRAVRRMLTPRGAVVLVYHRVTHLRVDPFALGVSPAHFEEHLDLISRSLRPLRARELVAALDRRQRLDGAVVVTFDDGYVDLLEEIRPRLERFDVPATAFLVSGAIDRTAEFWWDALVRVLLETTSLPPDLQLSYRGVTRRWVVGSRGVHEGWVAWAEPPGPREALCRELWELLVTQPPEIQCEVVDQLLAWAELDRGARPSHRTLRASELIALAEGDLVEVGAHTVEHPSLALLPRDVQRREMTASRTRLRQIVGQPVDCFAYPFGQPPHFTRETVRLARRAGFSAAFANVPGVASSLSDRYRIPRLFVGDCGGEQLASLLTRTTGRRIA